MTSTSGRSRRTAFRGVLRALIVTVVLALSACTGSGRFSATAVCERLGGDYVGGTCEHHTTPEELAAQQWCETHGGVYVAGNGCVLGSGGP
jgi:hypothetical protein